MASLTISNAAARRIALTAQGFTGSREHRGRTSIGPVSDGAVSDGAMSDGAVSDAVATRRIRRAIDTMGILQLDSVNVLARSHYLPIFARIGPYPREILDRLTAHTPGQIKRHYIEYWAHEASLIPLSTHPLLRWRMQLADEQAWGNLRNFATEKPDFIAAVLQLVAESGPLRSSELGIQRHPKPAGSMWNWHEGKLALELLFWRGEIGASRRINFERHYDLIERILPPEISEMTTPSRADAQRELLRIAARACGVATEPDLGDYFRLPRADSKRAVTELVETGELLPATVVGWDAPAYLWAASRRPRSVHARALLSPFDPLIWFRDRARRLFGFHYRIEIYTPAAQRKHGYYVLPFLLGDTLVGRVDLKADRQAGVLRVQSAWCEPDADAAAVVPELALELVSLADWLGLGQVAVADRGDLAAALGIAVSVLS